MTSAPQTASRIACNTKSFYPRRYICTMIVLLILCGGSPQANGKDLNVLIRVLYAAFLVEQASAVCLDWSFPFSDDDKAIFKDTKIYSQWIKQKVVAGLNDADVNLVLKSAADRAKAESLAAVGAIRSYGPERESAALRNWCLNTVRPFAKQVVSTYLNQPRVIDQLIEKAKAD